MGHVCSHIHAHTHTQNILSLPSPFTPPQPGFMYALTEKLYDENQKITVRQQAGLYLKNILYAKDDAVLEQVRGGSTERRNCVESDFGEERSNEKMDKRKLKIARSPLIHPTLFFAHRSTRYIPPSLRTEPNGAITSQRT